MILKTKNTSDHHRHVTRVEEGRGEVSPALFQNLKKSALFLGKMHDLGLSLISRFKCI